MRADLRNEPRWFFFFFEELVVAAQCAQFDKSLAVGRRRRTTRRRRQPHRASRTQQFKRDKQTTERDPKDDDYTVELKGTAEPRPTAQRSDEATQIKRTTHIPDRNIHALDEREEEEVE